MKEFQTHPFFVVCLAFLFILVLIEVNLSGMAVSGFLQDH